MAEIGGLRRTLPAPKGNKLEMSALRRWKEIIFLYRMVILKVKVEWEMPSEYRVQNVHQEFTWLVNCSTNQISYKQTCPTVFFLTKQTAGLYHLPLSSYSKNTQLHYIMKPIIVLRYCVGSKKSHIRFNEKPKNQNVYWILVLIGFWALSFQQHFSPRKV